MDSTILLSLASCNQFVVTSGLPYNSSVLIAACTLHGNAVEVGRRGGCLGMRGGGRREGERGKRGKGEGKEGEGRESREGKEGERRGFFILFF